MHTGAIKAIAIEVAKRVRDRASIGLVLLVGECMGAGSLPCALCLVTVITGCRSPFFDHRRKKAMQPALHSETTESKEVITRIALSVSAK
jgi:hypothetical protein